MREACRGHKKHTDTLEKNDAAAVAACFMQDGAYVTDTGPVNGREAIEKRHADFVKQFRLSNNLVAVDADSPHLTVGSEALDTAEHLGLILKDEKKAALLLEHFGNLSNDGGPDRRITSEPDFDKKNTSWDQVRVEKMQQTKTVKLKAQAANHRSIAHNSPLRFS